MTGLFLLVAGRLWNRVSLLRTACRSLHVAPVCAAGPSGDSAGHYHRDGTDAWFVQRKEAIASVKAGASARLTQGSVLAEREKDTAPAASVCGAHHRGRKCTQLHKANGSGSCRA